MDVRHESHEEIIINQIIQYINQLILTKTDGLVNDDIWRHHIIAVCQHLYRFLGMNVNFEEILSVKNLLSIDTVLLPETHDTNPLIINNLSRFNEMMTSLLAELNTPASNPNEVIQKKELIELISSGSP